MPTGPYCCGCDVNRWCERTTGGWQVLRNFTGLFLGLLFLLLLCLYYISFILYTYFLVLAICCWLHLYYSSTASCLCVYYVSATEFHLLLLPPVPVGAHLRYFCVSNTLRQRLVQRQLLWPAVTCPSHSWLSTSAKYRSSTFRLLMLCPTGRHVVHHARLWRTLR